MSHSRRSLRFIAITGLLILCQCAVAQTTSIDDLKKLLETDPTRGYAEAERLFEGERVKGDVEGMVDVLLALRSRLVKADTWLVCGGVVEEMASTALSAARQTGKWYQVGELCTLRALAGLNMFSGGCWPGKLRFVRFMEAADEAFEKSGRVGEQFTRAKAKLDEAQAGEQGLVAGRRKWRADNLGPQHGPAVEAMEQAATEGRDADAVALMQEIIEALYREPNEDYYRHGAQCVSALLWIPGADKAIPSLRRLVNERGDPSTGFPDIIGFIGWACWNAWTGRDDIYRDTAYWCFGHHVPGRHCPPWAFGSFAQKLGVFGETREAIRVIELFIELILNASPENRVCSNWAGVMVWKGAPPRVRRSLVSLMCEQAVRDGTTRTIRPSMVAVLKTFGEAWTAENPDWAVETGMALLDAAPEFEQVGHRVEFAKEAAKLFDVAGRSDLAQEARAFANELTAETPRTLLQRALANARSATAEERWEDVVAVLEDAATEEQPGAELVQAGLLLYGAYRELGRRRTAEACMRRARYALDEARLPAASHANYLMNMASLTDVEEQKVSLLREAEATAAQAGLDVLRVSITDRLARASLEADDLDAAEQALLDIIGRQEAKRDRLAFDPLLRQQWFADNLAPYRQLMRVAALQGDPYLALSCGERMRSRVLIDQLAWQKVDMGVNLAPEDQHRLGELRAMREQAAGMLQYVMGGAKPEDSDTRGKYMPIRGKYMPIRGMYMPIRGPLDKDEAATEDDVKRLKELLSSLAAEEAALESAIREAIPAYEMATQSEIPRGEELAEAVAQNPGLAVLEYTFCDEGLVVVALGPGGPPQVALIDQEGDALWERIGKFREMIWERRDEVLAECAALYEALVSPVAGTLAGAKRLWIIADGALQLVPFGALMGADNVYLAWHMPVATAPSLSLALTSRGAREKADRSAVVLAAPDTGAITLGSDDTRGKYMPIRGMYMPIRGKYMPIRGEGDVSLALTSMAMVPLPGAKAEGEAIARDIDGSLLLTGKQATKSRLLQEGATCDILHIATHGYADPDLPELSGLLLAGTGDKPYEVLTAQEVYGWPLRARLVALSACQTGLGKDVEGEGLLGLTRAFIYAGAQDVLCSLWPVSDASTKKLMVGFYADLRQGMPVEAALQEAQRALMKTKETNHPFFWAGFVAVKGPE